MMPIRLTLIERVLLRFGKTIHELGKAPAVVFKHALEHFSIEELSDAMIVIGYYRLLSIYIRTFVFKATRKRTAIGSRDKPKQEKRQT